MAGVRRRVVSAGWCSIVECFLDDSELGPAGHQEHMFTGGVVFGEKRAGAVIDGANAVPFTKSDLDVIRFVERSCERIYFILQLRFSCTVGEHI